MKKSVYQTNKKAQLNLSFGWLFAIIVGAIILTLTIWGVTKMIKTSGTEETVVGAADFGVSLNALETGFESASSVAFKTKVETMIHNKCSPSGTFGEQGIQLSEYSFNKWTLPGPKVGFKNRYIFSEKEVEGKKFYLFSKPFKFPFKVADLIYLSSSEKTYCFIDAPEKVEEEIIQMGQENILAEDCENKGYIEVCFNGGNCEINVDGKTVEKDGETLFFAEDEENALMYAAIFSDPVIYECQVQRLLMRTKELASLYQGKAGIMSCDSPLKGDLSSLINKIGEVDDSKTILERIGYSVERIKYQNDGTRCKLW